MSSQKTCSHIASVHFVKPSSDVCEECLRQGDRWVQLRLCVTCGNVGCCDSSKNKHATAHYHATQHPVIRSFDLREPDWLWCYEDKIMIEGAEAFKIAS